MGLIGIIGAGRVRACDVRDRALQLFWWAYPNDRHHIFYLFVGFLDRRRAPERLGRPDHVDGQQFSAYWHVLGVGIIVFACIFVPDHHQSAGYVFGQTINNSGFGGHTLGRLALLHGVR